MQEIYGEHLQLKRENDTNHTTNFLDMTITINNGCYIML